MKKILMVAAALATLGLAACDGTKSSHAVCIDNYSTSDYMTKWHSDLDAALAAGKITKEQKDDTEVAMLMFNSDPDDMGSVCNFADGERKKLGL